jgi:hypothetical protein
MPSLKLQSGASIADRRPGVSPVALTSGTAAGHASLGVAQKDLRDAVSHLLLGGRWGRCLAMWHTLLAHFFREGDFLDDFER